jgi:ABC-type transporter Mla subunit MlaD
LDDLQEFSELKKSLEAADSSLTGASEKIEMLATTLSGSIDTIRETIESLNETINVINKTNPAEVIKAYSSIERTLSKLADDYDAGFALLQNNLGGVAAPIETVMNDRADRLSGDIATAIEAVKTAVKGATSIGQSSSENAKKRMNVVFFLLIVNSAAIGFLLLKSLV